MFGNECPQESFLKYDLEYDLRTTDWIINKVQADHKYAQQLYSALCNNTFTKHDTWPLLKGEVWSCTWRYAGGIIAHMLELGDYLDWYCSGNEGIVADDVRNDLLTLGWIINEYDSEI